MSKITGYNAISSVQSDDVLPVVDVHDTTMAGTGTTKKITLAQVVAVQAPAYAPSGLTGATAATRYAGGTASGAPVSGTFAVGDFVIDQTGKVWVCTGAGSPGTWAQAGGGGGGAVSSVFTRTGAVVAASGDYTVSQVTGAAPLASPALTGTPTAPTATALTSSTQVATTAYADAAVGVETTRAQAAEAAKVASVAAADTSVVVGGTATAPTVRTNTLDVIATQHPTAATWSNSGHKIISIANGTISSDVAAFGQIPTSAATIGGLLAASNLSDLASATTARTSLGLGSAATQNSSAFDAAGAAAAAQAASLPLAGGTTTGSVVVGGALTTPPVTLTDAATIAVNAALSNRFKVTLGGNRTLGTPSNPADGQAITVEVTQPSSGGPYTLAYSAAYAFTSSTPQPSLSTGASAHDFISFVYDAGQSLWICTGYVLASNGILVTIAQGGTGQTSAAAAYNALSPMLTLGDLEYESGTNTAARLAGNTTTTKQFLTQTGTGTVSAAPAWGALAAGDVSPLLDTTATDIVAAGTQAAGAVGKPADAGHVHPAPGFPQPSDYGWVAWTSDPFASNGAVILISGTVYFVQFPVRYTRTLSNLIIQVTGAGGSGLTASENFVGIYNSSGTQVAVSADQSATGFVGGGVKTIAMTSPYSAAPGLYWAAIVANATTCPSIRSVTSASGGPFLANGGLTAANLRIAVAATGQTTLPSTITTSSLTGTTGVENLTFIVS